jgi:DNA-binding PadR family transcriptional regulator
MEHIILGLLVFRERTIYEIKKILEDTISLFYSASFGSINSAIKNMLAKEWISVREAVENGRFKKFYAITPAGRAAFDAWLDSPIPLERVKDPALTRLFFMGLMAPAQRIQAIEGYQGELQKSAATLAKLEAEVAQMDVPPEKADLYRFQRHTLQFGIAYIQFNLRWYGELLDELRSTNR